MKKTIIKSMIDSISNISYEIFRFEQLIKEYEKKEDTPYPDYIKTLYGIRYGTMLELEKKIKILREKLRKTLNEDVLIKRFDIGFKPQTKLDSRRKNKGKNV